MRSRPNSNRGQVRAAFESGGEPKALEVGQALGLPESKVKRWIRKFGVQPDQKTNHNKPRIRLKFWPERTGTIVKQGPEQSEIKFDDGKFAFESNKYLIDEKTGKRYYPEVD